MGLGGRSVSAALNIKSLDCSEVCVSTHTVCSFLLIAITNYYKSGGSEQQKTFWLGPGGQKPGNNVTEWTLTYRQGCVPSRKPGKESLFDLFYPCWPVTAKHQCLLPGLHGFAPSHPCWLSLCVLINTVGFVFKEHSQNNLLISKSLTQSYLQALCHIRQPLQVLRLRSSRCGVLFNPPCSSDSGPQWFVSQIEYIHLISLHLNPLQYYIAIQEFM